MYQTILVPLDGSTVAEVALPHATKMAEIFGSDIVLIRVAFAQGYPGSDPLDLQQLAIAESEAYLETWVQKLQAQGLKVSKVVRYGKAADEIIEHAVTRNISVIVMATHGRSGVGRWLLGSTAEKLLRGTTVPILLIRATPTPEAPSESAS